MNDERDGIEITADPAASDQQAGFELTPEFERFNQKYDVFRRSWWDDRVRSDKSEIFYQTYREPLSVGGRRMASHRRTTPFETRPGT